MSVNFSKDECQTKTNKERFGIYDAEDKSPAIIKIDDESSWNATVINKNSIELLFTAIDNCIDILRDNGEMDSRCDGMLTFKNTIFFVKLKNKRGSWQSKGLSQIESTIKRMMTEELDFYNSFTKRKAIVANRKHQFPSFHMSHSEQREYFLQEYNTRIQFEAGIIV